MNYKTTFFVALLIAVGDLGKQPFGDAKLVVSFPLLSIN